ncbi:MAG: filamentous hemagglutinin N-terminal domain-containing protein [gamma proteobacterium symbiont of Taylorina sp.]|nr:filamentous hemagglutinin N-terminal domain-containing protein [gamma proteobacterium symbiont of Taylorina sp.]
MSFLYNLTFNKILLFAITFILSCGVLYAEIITDGSTGAKLNIQGPDYSISEQLGTRAGDNLYHSFQSFNLKSNESAVFTGSNSIKNVISRVTGGDVSTINGLISSQIGYQGFYFINSSGIVFGNNASIDVPASFYASTSNHLSFSNGEVFAADLNTVSSFSSASPEAFGFAANSKAKIIIDGSTLAIKSGNQLSLVASELDINNMTAEQGARLTNNEGQIYLVANGAIINSVPIQLMHNTINHYSGDIQITNTEFDVRGSGAGTIALQGGAIILTDSNFTADNNGDTSGSNQILIKAQNFLMDQSSLDADTIGKGNGIDVNIDVDEMMLMSNKSNISMKTEIGSAGDSGDININADQFILQDRSHITSSTTSSGQAGDINIAARQISLNGYDNNATGAGVEIFSSSLSDAKLKNIEGERQIVISQALGNAGNITLQSEQIEIINAAKISTSTYAKGDAGKVLIAAKQINIDSGGYVGDYYSHETKEPEPIKTGIFSSSSVYYSEPIIIIEDGEIIRKTIVLPATGNAGLISINADDIQVNQGGQISTSTSAIGDAGIIELSANQLSIDHQNFQWEKTIDGEIFSGSWLTGLVSISQNLSPDDIAEGMSGDAGYLQLDIDQLNLESWGSVITSLSRTSGQAGTIDINSSKISLNNKSLISVVGQDGQVSDITAKPSINIYANDLTLSGQSNISAQSKGTASGGNISIKIKNDLELNSLSQISSEAVNSDSGAIIIDANSILLENGLVTSSVGRLLEGTPIINGDAGDISIKSDSLIMSDGFIQANTLGVSNRGGAIFIDTKQVVTAYNSLEVGGGFPVEFVADSGRNIIQAASPEGSPGEIIITSPIDNVTAIIQSVDSSFKSLAKISDSPCRQKAGEKTSSLTLDGRGALPGNSLDKVILLPLLNLENETSQNSIKTDQYMLVATGNKTDCHYPK